MESWALKGLMACGVVPVLVLFLVSAGHAAARQANPQATPVAGATLERVVLVSRHGIRSPTKPPAVLKEQTGRDWPTWPVAPGQLTDHGRQTLAAMTDAIARHYQSFGFLPSQGCPETGALMVWADAADDRTRESGAIMAEGLARHCGVSSQSLPAGQHDTVFNALPAEIGKLDVPHVKVALAQALDTDRLSRPADVSHALSRLQDLVAPAGCGRPEGPCFSTPLSLSWKQGTPHLSGGPLLASTTAENMLLAYVQGMSPDQVAWGAMHVATLLDEVLPAHRYVTGMTRRLPAMAALRGSVISAEIVDLMAGRPVILPDEHMISQQTKLTVFAGHDSTLDMLAAIFQLEWVFPDQPDPTAPDTTLAFERWRYGNGRAVVRVVLFHQSLEELRQGHAPDLKIRGAQVLPLGMCRNFLLCPVEIWGNYDVASPGKQN